MRNQFLQECRTLHENATYTAETHHTLSWVYGWTHRLVTTVPAAASAVLGVLVGSDQVSAEYLWLSVLSASIAAIGSVIDAAGMQEKHLEAAKKYTILKGDVRLLLNALHLNMSDSDFVQAVQVIQKRYNELVDHCVPTATWIFNFARWRVKSGIHEPDHVNS